MEPILGLIIVIVILFILGIPPDVIIFGLIGMLILSAVLSELFFIYCVIRLFFSKRCGAEFSRIGRRKRGKFDTAFYDTEYGELPNIFPAEVIMKDKIYIPGKPLKLRLDAGKKFVYDKNALLTIYIGTFLCALMSFLLIAGVYLMVFNYP